MCLYTDLVNIWKDPPIKFVEVRISKGDQILALLKDSQMTLRQLHIALPHMRKGDVTAAVNILLGNRKGRQRIALFGRDYKVIDNPNLREKVLEITKVETSMADILSSVRGHKGRQIIEMVKRLEGRNSKVKLIKHLKNGKYINV